MRRPYLEADQRLTALYNDQDAWARKAIRDHTIAQYATELW